MLCDAHEWRFGFEHESVGDRPRAAREFDEPLAASARRDLIGVKALPVVFAQEEFRCVTTRARRPSNDNATGVGIVDEVETAFDHLVTREAGMIEVGARQSRSRLSHA